nr:MAG: ORF1 [Anelloviridae sp.]
MYYRRRYRRHWRRPHIYHRRRRYPRRHWRRAWRRYRRNRVRRITQVQPRKKKYITVTGWEILGIIGSQLQYIWNHTSNEGSVQVRNVAPVNKQVDYLSFLIPPSLGNVCDDTWDTGATRGHNRENITYWNFVGGWGYAKFDLQSLILRNLLGFNRFSESITGYTHIRFVKFKLDLVRGRDADYLYRLQMHRGPKDFEQDLIHPAHLLNMPFVTWVESIQRSKCCRHKILRRRPGTDLTGWYDIESFRNFELFSYMWTVFDPDNPMGKNPNLPNDKKWWNDDWMRTFKKEDKIKENIKIPWTTRSWDNTFVSKVNSQQTGQKTWWDWLMGEQEFQSAHGKQTPFLPPLLPTQQVNTLWFRYKIVFQVGGGSITRVLQNWPIRETSDNAGKCSDPSCRACIKEGDTDDSGILTDEALERITESPEHREKTLVEKLTRIIRQRRKRKRVRWWDSDTEEEEKEPGPSHAHTQKRKDKRIRYLASRLGLRLVRE